MQPGMMNVKGRVGGRRLECVSWAAGIPEIACTASRWYRWFHLFQVGTGFGTKILTSFIVAVIDLLSFEPSLAHLRFQQVL